MLNVHAPYWKWLAAYDILQEAEEITRDAIEVSTKQPHFQERGVSFEPLLGKVAALLQ